MSDEVRPRRFRRWMKRLAVGFLAVVGVLALVTWGTRIYLGQTTFAEGTLPDWLYDGVRHIERTDLASDDAAWITGGVYLIDGGSLAWRGANA